MHDKIFGKFMTGLILCGLLLVQAGCSRGVDVGRLTNPNRPLEQTVAASTLATYKAAMAALRELNMSIIGEYYGNSAVDMKTEFADKTIAWIEITSLNAVSCKVAVNVDVLSDESRSRSILTAILKNLPNESAVSEMRPIKDDLKKQPENSSVLPELKDENSSALDVHETEKIKPMPKEVVTEKNLL